jgi:hypothetical protein
VAGSLRAKKHPTGNNPQGEQQDKFGPGRPKTQSPASGVGHTGVSGSPADFGKLVTEDAEKWAKVIKFLGVKAD